MTFDPHPHSFRDVFLRTELSYLQFDSSKSAEIVKSSNEKLSNCDNSDYDLKSRAAVLRKSAKLQYYHGWRNHEAGKKVRDTDL